MSERLTIWRTLSFTLALLAAPDAARAQEGPTSDQPPSSQSAAKRKSSFRMTPGVVCRSIDGYEQYRVLPKAEQTSDEKLLVYFRPLGFALENVDGAYQAHLYPDFQIRKRGEKSVLLQKMKMYEFKPKSDRPEPRVYMKNVISLKGLPPGDYDLTIILHDEIAKGPPASQVIRFRVIPPTDVREQEKTSQSTTEPARSE